MQKRVMSVLLALSILLSMGLIGCSAPTAESTAPNTDTTQDSTSSTATSEPSVAPPTEAPDDSPVDSTVEPPVEPSVDPEIDPTNAELEEAPEEEPDLTTTQRNSINMLNYITVLTQQINDSKGSRIYLESVQSSLQNNIYPNAVDRRTQNQINNLWETIESYRMVAVKREHLEYIYAQNKALALKNAFPDPVGLLSAVEAKNLLKTAASLLYMAVDAKTSYEHASTKADLEYLQDGWELEKAEAEALSASNINLLNYMFDMVRDNDFPGEFGLTADAVADFVKWTNEENLVRKIRWLEENEETYCEFRTYWLVLAQSYFFAEEYSRCLSAIERFEAVATRIFRADHDFAETLPMVIASAKETMSNAEYIAFADEYVKVLLHNCEKDNWALRYFAAQTYIDLYLNTNDLNYLEEAYKIVSANVNELVDEQKALNEAYLAPIEKITADKNATKRQKQEIKEYNDFISETRKKELPPVSEALYLNCELLFTLADKLNISSNEKNDIDAIIHENGQLLFLIEALDNRFWASRDVSKIDSSDINIEFTGDKLVIPANCLINQSAVKVSTSNGAVLDDWIVTEVVRPKNSSDCSTFAVTLISQEGKQHTYTEGETIKITVAPVVQDPEKTSELTYIKPLEFKYEVIAKKSLGVFNGVEFERILK